MSFITIADRRTIMTNAVSHADFRDLLRQDPRAAIAQTIGTAPEGRISVIEEQPDAWEFIIPAGAIEADLPAPVDPRSVVENDVYELLRDDPEARARVTAAPKTFLAEKFQLDIGPAGVNVREEAADELLIVLPYREGREELSDDALDLVAGGGQQGCQTGGPINSERPKDGGA